MKRVIEAKLSYYRI